MRCAARREYEEFVDVIDEMIQRLHIDRVSAQIPSRDMLLASDQKIAGIAAARACGFSGIRQDVGLRCDPA